MTTKRTFSCEVIGSDAFCDLSHTAQLAYFHLGMSADNYGFVGGPKRILRTVNLSADALEELEESGFILAFRESGVIVIAHWWQNNNPNSARFAKTTYTNEYGQLIEDAAGVYCLKDKNDSSGVAPQDFPCGAHDSMRGDENNIEEKGIKNNIEEDEDKSDSLFIYLSLDQARTYVVKVGSPDFDAQYFCDYCTARNWRIGKSPMRDRRATVHFLICNKNAKNKVKKEVNAYEVYDTDTATT